MVIFITNLFEFTPLTSSCCLSLCRNVETNSSHRERGRERQAERVASRETSREREAERETNREREAERDKQRERERGREWQTSRERERQVERGRDITPLVYLSSHIWKENLSTWLQLMKTDRCCLKSNIQHVRKSHDITYSLFPICLIMSLFSLMCFVSFSLTCSSCTQPVSPKCLSCTCLTHLAVMRLCPLVLFVKADTDSGMLLLLGNRAALLHLCSDVLWGILSLLSLHMFLL